MTTSGTSTFNLDLAEAIEEGYERIGIESDTGYDIRTARRSLNLLSLEWANRQVNLWTIEVGTIALLANTATYDLPVDTVDLLDVVIRTTSGGVNSDLAIGRLSVGNYSSIPTKDSTGRPVQFYVNRQAVTPTVTVWPVPPDTSYTLVYWRMRRIQDTGQDGSYTLDIPARFLPPLVSGLAYYLAMKRAPERLTELKAIYDEQFLLATNEDRERASFQVRPRIGYL